MSQTKIPKTTTSPDASQNSSPISSIPQTSNHHVTLEHMAQGFKNLWRRYFDFSGDCIKRRGGDFMLDPEEIERRDEYRGYGVDAKDKAVIPVLQQIGANFRIHKYSQPSFLKIYFTSMEQLTDLAVKKLTKMMRATFTKVEGLVLDFRHCRDITDASIEYICTKVIRNFSHLKHLRLNFYECRKISDKAFMMLIRNITNYLPKLTHLFLNFLLCEKIGEKGIEFFAQQISRKLPKLTHFKVDFALYNFFCKITPNKLTTLYNKFGQKLTNLEFLELHTRSIWDLKDENLKILEDSIIKRLSGLKHISIRLGNAYYISSQAFGSLFSTIAQHLPRLTSLNIHFFSCQEINDDDVRTILTAIHEKCKSLARVKVHFEGSRNVKGIEEFPDKQTITDYLNSEFKPRGSAPKSPRGSLFDLFKK